MADKVPVQDKLSQILAELMWCLAGTEEDDEYAGQLYLQMDEQGDEFFDEEDCDDGEEEQTSSVDKEMMEKGNQIESDDDSDEFKVLSVERVEGDSEEDSIDNQNNTDEELQQGDEKHCRGAHLVSLYIATFLRTVRREWGNVDKHRVDKFYTAVRLMLSEVSLYTLRMFVYLVRFISLTFANVNHISLFQRHTSTWPNAIGIWAS